MTVPYIVAKYTEAVEREAWCPTCGKRWTAANALAVAYRHAQSTGHATEAVFGARTTYTPRRPVWPS